MATHGYLIVKTFERLWEEFSKPWDGPGNVYGIPKKGMSPSRAKKRYRGIDRDPLEPFSDKDVELLGDTVAPRIEAAAQRTLAELEEQGRVVPNFMRSPDDARAVFALLERLATFEIIWARDYLDDHDPAAGATCLLGYEPSYLRPDHFSAVADCLFLPRWHGTDKEGKLFKPYFDSLNENGLFNSAAEALTFLDYYRSFDWTETGAWVITEVREANAESPESATEA
jgi:hypothetical protein